MKNSCVWFSKLLTERLGLQKFELYLAHLEYGNQDASDGLTHAWLSSSLKISIKEQVIFIRKMLEKKHPVSSHAVLMTRQILFLEELSNRWKLFGKTGWSGSTTKLDGENELGLFVGWVEKEDAFFPFAYAIRTNQVNLAQRIPRVKQLLIESNLINRNL